MIPKRHVDLQDDFSTYTTSSATEENSILLVSSAKSYDDEKIRDEQKNNRIHVQAPNEISVDSIFNSIATGLMSGKSTTVEKALAEIADRCWNGAPESKKNCEKVFALGGHLLIGHAQKSWSAYAGVQRQAARALQNAGSGMSKVAKKFREAAMNIGAMDFVLTAMKNFPDDADVQECGSGALLNLVVGNKLRTKHFVKDCAGLRTVAKAMKSFQRIRDLQEIGCRIFDNASKWSELQSWVLEAHGLQILANAYESNMQDETIQCISSRAITRLCKPVPVGLQSKTSSSIMKWPSLPKLCGACRLDDL